MRATGPGQPGHLLLDILDVLVELRVPYAIVEAFAVSYHAVPRSTEDAGAVLWLGAGKGERDLKEPLLAAGYRAEWKRGDIDDPISSSVIVQDRHGNRVDLLLRIRGMDPAAPTRTISTRLLDSPVCIIAAEDLIAMKMFAGGIQDLEDVRGILQVSGKLLNMELLRSLTERYGRGATRKLEKLLQECSS